MRPRASGESVPRICPRYDREQMQRDELRGERLGRRDADLRAGVRVDGALGLARGHAADDVADRDAAGALSSWPRAAPPSVSAVSPDCVITIASVFFDDDRIAIAVLGAVVDVHRHARQRLDQELADQRRVPRRAAREDHDPLDLAQHAVGNLDLLEEDLAGLDRRAAEHRLLAPPTAARRSP